MDICKTLIIEGREVLISTVDEVRITEAIENNRVTLNTLDKFIFGLSKTYGTTLRLFHKNSDMLDFRRSNLILTSQSFIRKLSKIPPYKGYIETVDDKYYHSIGIHLDHYKQEYQIITFDKRDKYICINEKSIGESIKIFNTYKTNTLENIKIYR